MGGSRRLRPCVFRQQPQWRHAPRPTSGALRLTHGAAARRLAGRGAGQLAGCPRGQRHLAGAHRRCGHAALHSRGRPDHPEPAGPVRSARWGRRVAVSARRAVPTGAGLADRATPGLPCACSRKGDQAAQLAWATPKERHAALPYPGTCRQGLHGRSPRAWRFNTTDFLPKSGSSAYSHKR